MEARRSEPRTGGFTHIELVMVILILGLLFSLTTVSLSGLAPVYRVRSISRVVGAAVEEVRALAIARGMPLGIRYNMDETPPSYQIIPPAPPDYPDEPIELRKLGEPHELPTGVKIRRVSFPGAGAVDRGSVNVVFSPMGNTGSHVITFEGTSKSGQPILISMKFNAITGTIDFAAGEVEIQQLEG